MNVSGMPATGTRATGTSPGAAVPQSALWRAVAVPSEHGGWGLTLEPVLLGLLVAFSWPGLAIGVAALLAFLVRTPLKLALVDRRRQRSLPRTRLAWRFAAAELALIALLGSLAVAGSGWSLAGAAGRRAAARRGGALVRHPQPRPPARP